MFERRQMFVNGTFVDAVEGDTLDVVDPATGYRFGTVPAGTADDVDRAVAAARRAFDEGPWPTRMGERDRGAVLARAAERVRDERRRLAELEVRDCGKPLAEALGDVDEAAFMLEYYAGWTTKIAGDIPPVGPDALSLVVKEPVGVCGLITPWNYPLLMATQKVAPALAAGCTVVLKPAEQTPMTALELARILSESGLPDGVCNVVTGDGLSAGAPLVEHPGVDKISFTGSLEVGRIVQAAAAATLKRVTLELGGKSPNIVFADADFDAAIDGTCAGIFGNQGEVCSAGSRIFVQRPIYNRTVEAMAAVVGDHRLGSGLDPETTMGPLVSAEQRERVRGYVALGLEEGAEVFAEGSVPDDPALAGGYWVAPTILTGVRNTMRVAQEEIFGPVAAVMPFDDAAEVVRLANDSPYGLAAAIWTRDITTALRTARAVRAGVVWINDSQPAPSEAVWGGFKQSGIGRELGPYALDAYLETKQIYVNLG